MAEELIGQYGYLGIAMILILGGLGLPIPEEVPIILAAVLARNGQMATAPALASCLGGVIVGDFVVYLLGYWYGERVMSLPLTRRWLTRQREAQIKGYFHRHGFKILISGRFVPGFRSAAYLTAGILKLPPLKLLLTDLLAVTISTLLMFGLGFLFAHQIQKGIHEVQQWLTVIVAAAIGGWILYRFYQGRRRAGLPVGPPVAEADEVPLPPVELDQDGMPGDAEPPPVSRRDAPSDTSPHAADDSSPASSAPAPVPAGSSGPGDDGRGTPGIGMPAPSSSAVWPTPPRQEAERLPGIRRNPPSRSSPATTQG